MGNQQSRWRRRVQAPLWQSSPYVQLSSSSQTQPLLREDCLDASYSQQAFGMRTGNYADDIEAIHTRYLENKKEMDEVRRKIDALQSTSPMKLERKDYRADIQMIYERNAALETEINKLRRKVLVLQLASLSSGERKSPITIGESNTTLAKEASPSIPDLISFEPTISDVSLGQEKTPVMIGETNTTLEKEAYPLTSDLISFEPTISDVPPSETEHQRMNEFEEILAAGLLIVIFLLSVIIGMLLP